MYLFIFYAFLSWNRLTGFEDIVHMGAALAAMSRGSSQVDGCTVRKNRRVPNGGKVGRELGHDVLNAGLCSAGWTDSCVWMVEALKAWC